MGKKTSVYLSDELAERVAASGVSPGELIRRGLDAGQPEPLEVMLRRVLESVLGERPAVPRQPVRPHAINCKCGICKPTGGRQ